jgi:hypothetical protein
MNRFLYAAITLVATIALLIACGQRSPQHFGLTAIPGPANPVVPVDNNGNGLGFGGNAIQVTIGGSSDAGGIVQNDPIAAAISLNQAVVQNVSASSGVLVDGGLHYVIAATVTNEGTSTAWWQLYSGQTVADAGGTNDAGTVPTLQIRCPAGTICGLPATQSPVLVDGGVWYSSSTAGLLTVDAGTQSMTVNLASIR